MEQDDGERARHGPTVRPDTTRSAPGRYRVPVSTSTLRRHRRSRAAPPGEPRRPGSDVPPSPGRATRWSWRSASRSTPRARCFRCWCCRTPPACSAGTPSTGCRVRDDAGREYEVAEPRPAGRPRRPPDRRLDRAGAAAGRAPAARSRSPGWCARRSRGGGSGVERPLAGTILDARDRPGARRAPAVPMPDEPREQAGAGRPAQVPARTFGGFRRPGADRPGPGGRRARPSASGRSSATPTAPC